jgi:hypothetical protein
MLLCVLMSMLTKTSKPLKLINFHRDKALLFVEVSSDADGNSLSVLLSFIVCAMLVICIIRVGNNFQVNNSYCRTNRLVVIANLLKPYVIYFEIHKQQPPSERGNLVRNRLHNSDTVSTMY